MPKLSLKNKEELLCACGKKADEEFGECGNCGNYRIWLTYVMNMLIARIGKCPLCGEKLVEAPEIKRGDVYWHKCVSCKYRTFTATKNLHDTSRDEELLSYL